MSRSSSPFSRSFFVVLGEVDGGDYEKESKNGRHPFIFSAGDCITFDGGTRTKNTKDNVVATPPPL